MEYFHSMGHQQQQADMQVKVDAVLCIYQEYQLMVFQVVRLSLDQAFEL